jgi:hypothetical protein
MALSPQVTFTGKEDGMYCYNAQLVWQINLRDAFLVDRQMKLPFFDYPGDELYEDALNLLNKLVK